MKKLFVLLFGLLISWNVVADDIKLNPSHPDRHIVVKGDTLWDISARFLQTPWRWPEIWQANKQVGNPHLIYPGDIIELSFVDGKPVLSLNRGNGKLSPSIRRSSLGNAIPAIPISAISAFLDKPRVMTQEEYNSAPYIVAFDDEHILGSSGHKAYVRSFKDGIDDGYVVFRQGEEYLDSETGESLGFESVFIAESAVTLKGDPTTVMLSKSTREVRKGDRLLSAIDEAVVLNYFPRSPDSDIKGRIIGVMGGVSQVAQFDVVVIDRGKQDGVEVGYVLQIDNAGETIIDGVEGGEEVTLPDEEAGALMVFRVFDRVSYGLVMEGKRVMHRHDVVRTP